MIFSNNRWSHSHGDDGRSSWPRPNCQGVYNLFHLTDPLAARLEPLLSARFANTRPVTVPRYQRYPLGDGKSTNLTDFVQNNPQLFQETNSAGSGSAGITAITTTPPQTANGLLSKRRQSDGSFFHGSNTSLGPEHLASQMTSRTDQLIVNFLIHSIDIRGFD